MQVLLLYPITSQKALSIFDCVPYGDESRLRADPIERCYDATWDRWAALARLCVIIYCFGVPLAVVVAARRYGRGSPAQRRCVHVLIRACELRRSRTLTLDAPHDSEPLIPSC